MSMGEEIWQNAPDFSSPSGRSYINWGGERVEVSRKEHVELMETAVKSINKEQHKQWVDACGADKWANILGSGWAMCLVKASRLINADRDILRCLWELRLEEKPDTTQEKFLKWIKDHQRAAERGANNQYAKWFGAILAEMQDRVAPVPTGFGAWS